MSTVSKPFNPDHAFMELTRVVEDGFINLERRISAIDSSGTKTCQVARKNTNVPDAEADASIATNQKIYVPKMPIFAIARMPNQIRSFPFNRLPLELRMEIWKLASPSKRIFEPHAEIRRPQAQHRHIAPDPLPITLRWSYKPPALRAVCHESRQASNIIGGFKFGRMGNTRRGYWFNYEGDVVFINSDMMDYVHQLDLRRVSNLGFLYLDFKTEQGCKDLLDSIVQYAPDCRTVAFYFQETDVVIMSTAKLGRLADSDLVGNYEFSGRHGLPTGLAEWGNLRQAVYNIWEEHLTQLGRDTTVMPCLVGFDVLGR